MADAGSIPPFGRAVVLGAGRVGGFFAGLLAASGADVVLGDIQPRDTHAVTPGLGQRLIHDATLPPEGEARAALALADLVVISLPHAVAGQAVSQVLDVARPGALVADTSSVMRHLSGVMALGGARSDLRIVGVNPMFAPGQDVRGRPVLLVDPRGPDVACPLQRFLASLGFEIVMLDSPEKHDRLCAALQVTVHAAVLAAGAALAAAPFTAEELLAVAPPPCRVLLLLLARMGGQAPEVYSDIQSANPFAADTRASLSAAIAAMGQDGPDATAEIIGDIRTWLGEQAAPLVGDCSRLFALDFIRQPPGRGEHG